MLKQAAFTEEETRAIRLALCSLMVENRQVADELRKQNCNHMAQAIEHEIKVAGSALLKVC